ncbi:hypothetical protein C1646_772805 [Rhizophagus diaphanus]|nr:hypothetical protein C1646_772805 [Rhizophagus diaphanus] [Rhizophagus sp. MUCL 43196]
MTKSLEESGEKVAQLSNSVAYFKSIIPDTKKTLASAEKSIDLLENKCWYLEDVISAKNRKIIALIDQILSYTKYSDVTTEPETYSMAGGSEQTSSNIVSLLLLTLNFFGSGILLGVSVENVISS